MGRNSNNRPGFGRATLGIVAVVTVIYSLSYGGAQPKPPQPQQQKGHQPSRPKPETFRLVHAIGNTERVNASELSQTECDARKNQAKIVAAYLGVGGSITCLPESMFRD
ncbi:hypothetical protein [Aminobacter sp. J44]|uniref:hypothetical protein n=1 Tax=Aminobacter sp. J44 TaxID=935262 RepID=UPI00119B59ED|nr:hypothetical protein [Aminobacter sp. J44]TWG53548.1 hypothetical protein L610_000500000170 [Aminobacter sp. J44]